MQELLSPEEATAELVASPLDWLLQQPEGFGIVEQQMDRYCRYSAGHDRWAEEAKTCTEFVEGKQYSDLEIAKLVSERRPYVKKNMIYPVVRIVCGYQRQNRYEGKILAGNDGTTTKAMADVLNACLKAIDEQNMAQWNDSYVFQDGIIGGRAFWDYRLNFDRNQLGEIQETVENPFDILLDPEADAYNPDDLRAPWGGFIKMAWRSLREIAMQYGPAVMDVVADRNYSLPVMTGGNWGLALDSVSPESYFGGSDMWKGGRYGSDTALYASPFAHIDTSRKLVRVIDCQHRELKRMRFFLDMETGQEKNIPDDMPDEQVRRMVQWCNMRQLPLTVREGTRSAVRWTVTAGDRVLFDKWSPYDGLTIVPYFPFFRRGTTRGMVHDLLDPQREVNRRASAMLHVIMTQANSGWVYEEGSLDVEFENALRSSGARPGLNLKYKQGFQAPERIQPANAPMGLDRLSSMGQDDIRVISGINESAQGMNDNATSGRAVQARQAQAIVGAEPYFDNFRMSRELCTRKKVNLVQNFMTEERIVGTQSGKGGDEMIRINARNAAGELVNNVTIGQYQIAVDEAPMSATFMQGQFQEALELVGKGVQIPQSILVKMSSMPFKEEIIAHLEETEAFQRSAAQTQDLLTKSAAGIPPGQPLPQVVTPDVGAVSQPAQPAAPEQPAGLPLVPGAPPANPAPATAMTPMPAPAGAPAPAGVAAFPRESRLMNAGMG